MTSERFASKNDKKLQERLQGRLKQLRKEDGNGRCADCDDTDTRFASVSLGTFICNRCFGLHRALGTHLTKTRVLNLDAWTEDEVNKLEAIGNIRANAYFLAKLPSQKRPPMPDYSDRVVERFLREKYEERKYCADGLPPWERESTRSPPIELARIHPAKAEQEFLKSSLAKPSPTPASCNLLVFPDDSWDPFGSQSPFGKEPHRNVTADTWDVPAMATPWPQWPCVVGQANESISNWPTHQAHSHPPWDNSSNQVGKPMLSPSNPWAKDLLAPGGSGNASKSPMWPTQSPETCGQAGNKKTSSEATYAAGTVKSHTQTKPWQSDVGNGAQGRQASWASEFDPLWK